MHANTLCLVEINIHIYTLYMHVDNSLSTSLSIVFVYNKERKALDDLKIYTWI
jgi:hypothetical protein